MMWKYLLETSEGTVTAQEAKHEAIFQYFQQHIGTHQVRKHCLNFANIGWQRLQLQHLELPFHDHEIDAVIKALPSEKAPGPDGFLGLFLKHCWTIIKEDIFRAFSQFYNMNSQDLHLLNQAYVVLIPKKSNATRISEFSPISLIHTFAKLVSKVLANRLAPELHKMVSINQNAFIKKRCIHGNFMFVQQVIKDLHKKKIPALFVKLDISKAFDSVSWPYLLDIMKFLGFGLRWCNWISMLWCTSSSSFLLNGEPGKCVLHQRGVRQGDPLSPMIFLLAMEPLHRMFQMAQNMGALHVVHSNCMNFRMSLYADDAALFIKPTLHDLAVTKILLNIFGEASGLVTNMTKTEFFPIRADHIDLEDLLDTDRCVARFPC